MARRSVDLETRQLIPADARRLADKPAIDVPCIDSSVHARPASTDALRHYLGKEWTHRRLGPGERYYYPNPSGDYVSDAYGASGAPGSDRKTVGRQLFETFGLREAILLPLGLGLLPDTDLGTAVAAAINDWQANEWLSGWERAPRLWGSIRIFPRDVPGSIAEIERWHEDPRFVQIAMPAQSLLLYGDRSFHPLWEAAQAAGLPVVIHADAESGIEYWPTPNGHFNEFWEFSAYESFNSITHVLNLMAEGVFDRWPNLRLVLGDGAFDVIAALVWRWDKDYRPTRVEMPWMRHHPSEYLSQNCRFVTQRGEGPGDDATRTRWAATIEAGSMLLFGSSYPYWSCYDPREAIPTWPSSMADDIFYNNANATYRLDQRRARRTGEAHDHSASGRIGHGDEGRRHRH